MPVRIIGVSWDVTVEVRHAHELQAHAEHVQTLLDRISVASKAAGISTWEFDLRAQKFLWVENRTKAYGLDHVSLEEYGAGIRKLIHPDDMAEMNRISAEAITSGQQTYSYRFRVVRRDGTLRHLQSYLHIVRDDAGLAMHLGALHHERSPNDRTVARRRHSALGDRLAIGSGEYRHMEIDLVEQNSLVENPLRGPKALASSLDHDEVRIPTIARHCRMRCARSPRT
jgi:PAS domain S-box-containing protein